ncbi:MAG: uracil phosphoribosyltransferase [Bacteroidetes bacterium]|nr:uracil phosphoribosyltransferase [Bacteroidota bacterium]
MMVNILGSHNSLFNQFIAEVRDEKIQADSMRFRRNMERLGEIFAYEISKKLQYETKEVVTSLGIAEIQLLKHQPVIASILRAGLPFHNGLLNFFDQAENAFISAYRKHDKKGNFNIEIEYLSCPDLTDKILILADPMLATGASLVKTYKELLLHGKPSHTYFVSVLASAEGIDYVHKNLSSTAVSVWVGAVDDELTAQAYIVPGLGDAGDLAFGKKVQY